MEKRTEVKIIRVELVCERCHEGTMELCDGIVSASNPPPYRHRCTKCNHANIITGKTYPYMEYE